MNRNCIITVHTKIKIANNVSIGSGTHIYDHGHDSKGGYVIESVTIEERVWIGTGCIRLEEVTVSSNSVIATGMVPLRRFQLIWFYTRKE